MLKPIVLLAVSAIFLNACQQPQPNEQIMILNESLARANKDARQWAEGYYARIQDNMEVPRIHVGSSLWFTQAKLIHKLGSDIIKYLDELNTELAKKWDSVKYAQSSEPGNDFIKTGKAEKLFRQLVKYKTEILTAFQPSELTNYDYKSKALNEDLNRIKYEIPLLAGYSDSINTDEYLKKWVSDNFANADAYLCRTMINRIEYDINISQQYLLLFGVDNTNSHSCMPGRYSMIAGVVSSYVKAGEQMEVVAGMGEFRYRDSIEIKINGVAIPLNDEGIVTYKFKATNRPGKYTVPVQVRFKDQDGKMMVMERELRYRVRE